MQKARKQSDRQQEPLFYFWAVKLATSAYPAAPRLWILGYGPGQSGRKSRSFALKDLVMRPEMEAMVKASGLGHGLCLDTRNTRNAKIQVLAETTRKATMKADAQILKRWLGMALFILSFALYGLLILVPFIPFSAESRIAFSAAIVILAESSFWLSVLILGREVIAKYRKVDWRSLLSRLKKI